MTQPGARGLWIFSGQLDLLVFTLPAALALLVLAASPAARSGADSPEWAWLVGILMVDVAHVWSTAFITYFNPSELARHARRYWLIPFGGWVLGVLAYAAGGPGLFWRGLAYLAVFHFVRQQYGWMALYRARGRERGRLGAWIDGGAIYAATLYPLLYWHCHLPRRFDWFLPGDFVPGLPRWLSTLAGAAYLAILVAYLARALWQARAGQPIAWGKHLLLGTTAATWYAGIVATDGDYAFTISNVFVHGIPYAALVFAYGRHVAPQSGGFGPRLLGSKLAAALPAFLGCLWLLAFLEELLWDRGVWHERPGLFGAGFELDAAHVWLVPLLALPQLTHYVLDGVFWRRAQNPELRAWFEGEAAVR